MNSSAQLLPAKLLHAVRTAIDRGDFPAAQRIASELVRRQPDLAEGHFLLGMASAEIGQVRLAAHAVAEAVERDPNAEHLAHHARLLVLIRREADARIAADRAAAAGSTEPLTLDTIGCVYSRLGDHAAAAAMFTPAVARAPDNLNFRYNLAASLGFLGRVDEAAAEYEAILARSPGDGRTHYALSLLRKQRLDDNHVARLETALAAGPVPADRLRLHYALAKEYEDIGDHAATFRHLDAGNRQRKAEIGYDFAQDAALFDAIEAVSAKPGFLAGQGDTGQGDIGQRDSAVAPIFVLGMPRTGTTLVDRILSSHPLVHSAGELQAMPLGVKQLAGTTGRTVIDPETIAASAGIDPGKLAETYMLRARQHLRRQDGRFIDKLPANFLYVGHILRAMPSASIVCLRRNPMDSVWSNYKNLFAANSPYYFYSYDLLDTAAYWVRFDRLMAHWRALFPGRVLEIGYEALVADQEGESRRLIAHCSLAWDDACLDFHANTAAVATPSAAQVRRPIYKDAVARWKKHADALEPVLRFFEANGVPVE